MATLKGSSGAGTIILNAYNVPCTIRSFILSNLDTPTLNVTVFISDGSNDFIVSALNYQIKQSQAYVRDSPIYVDKDNYIKIVTTGTIGYYFSID